MQLNRLAGVVVPLRATGLQFRIAPATHACATHEKGGRGHAARALRLARKTRLQRCQACMIARAALQNTRANVACEQNNNCWTGGRSHRNQKRTMTYGRRWIGQ
eukprot:8000888-Lingulodinium_polyedra.AAC.1